MQHLEVSGAVRPIYGSLGVKRLKLFTVQELSEVLLRWRHRNFGLSYEPFVPNILPTYSESLGVGRPVAVLSRRNSGFEPSKVNVEFVVDEDVFGFLSQYFSFPLHCHQTNAPYWQ